MGRTSEAWAVGVDKNWSCPTSEVEQLYVDLIGLNMCWLRNRQTHTYTRLTIHAHFTHVVPSRHREEEA